MPTRIAASLALVVFAVCVIAGMAAHNPFTTVITRALLAMVVTLVIGLVLGSMAQKMLDENLASEAAKAAQEPAGAADAPAAGAGAPAGTGVKEKSGNPERNPGARGR